MLASREPKKRRLNEELKSTPECIKEFYIAINIKPFQYETIQEILFRDNFHLHIHNNKEVLISPVHFSQFHDHCFQTPLLAICHIASQHLDISDKNLLEIIQRLVALGADLKAKDEEGKTPLLLLASSLPNREIFCKSIHFLIQSGSELTEKDQANKTVLHHACKLMNFELLKFFFSIGAPIILDEAQNTFIMECEEEEHAPTDLLNYKEALIESLQIMGFLKQDYLDETEDELLQYVSEVCDEECEYEDDEFGNYLNSDVTPKAFIKILEAAEITSEDSLVTNLFNFLNLKMQQKISENSRVNTSYLNSSSFGSNKSRISFNSTQEQEKEKSSEKDKMGLGFLLN